MRATINDTEVYMADDALPAFSSSINKITDPSKVSGVTSTTLKVLATVEAKRVLGSEFMAEAKRTARPTLRIGDAGDLFTSQILPVRRDRDVIECLAVGGNASWFEYAKGVNLQEFDFGLSDIVTATTVADSWTNIDLLYFPLIDYGSFGGRDDTYDVDYRELRPGFRCARALEIVLAAGGWSIKAMGSLGSIGTGLNAKWYKYVMPCSTDFVRSIRGYSWVVGTGDGLYGEYQINKVGTAPTTFHNIGDPPGTGYDGFTDTLTVTDDGYFRLNNLYLKFTYDTTEAVTLDGSRLRIVIWDFTDGRELWGEWMAPLTTNPAGGIIEIGTLGVPEWYGPAYGLDGHSIAIGVLTESDGVTLDLNSPGFTYYKEADYRLTEISPIVINSVMPDMSAMDLLMGLRNQFNLAFVTKGREIHVWYLDDYVRRPLPSDTRDWTGRSEVTNPPAKTDPEQPSILHLAFKEDSSDLDLSRLDRVIGVPGYGNADVIIGGYGAEQTITLPWSATAMTTTFGTCYIPAMRDSNAEAVGGFLPDVYKRTPRILVADGLTDGTWKFDGNAKTTYPRCYFEGKKRGALPTAFGNATVFGGDPENTLVNTLWEESLRRMIDAQYFEGYLMIFDHEMLNFDHGMPTLVDDGSGPAWYYVQEITQHQFGANIPTKCTLIQIPGKEVVLNPDTVMAGFPILPVVPVTGDFNDDFNDDFNNG